MYLMLLFIVTDMELDSFESYDYDLQDEDFYASSPPKMNNNINGSMTATEKRRVTFKRGLYAKVSIIFF